MLEESANPELKGFTIEQLLREVCFRDPESVVDEHGRVPSWVYRLLAKWTPMPFVDAFAVKMEEGHLWAGIIRRKTGPYPGKFCLIGGKNGQDETFEQSLLYNWEADLGIRVKLVEGTKLHDPMDTMQYMRRSPVLPDGTIPVGLGWDPGKNSRSHVYAVKIIEIIGGELRMGEKTNDIGAEAEEFYWIKPYESDPTDFGYPGMHASFMRAWKKLYAGILSDKYIVV